jgi:prevent-host-death family protein
MKRLDIADLPEQLAGYARESADGPLVITDRGTPVAAIVPLAGMDWETIAVSLSPTFQAIMQRARDRRRAEGGLSHAEILHRFGLD